MAASAAEPPALGVLPRYPALDVLRGLALVSMISSHMDHSETSTFIGRMLHSGRWINGAYFFVALSGVVTGLVHRRVVERSGLHASAAKLVRRAGFLYVVHISLTLIVLATYNAKSNSVVPDTPSWSQAGGVGRAIEQVVLLRLEPDMNSVLPMYVAVLLWAVVVFRLLERGRWGVVVGISVVVFVFGQTVNGLSLATGGFAIADWQLLFTGGLLVGWTWEHERSRLSGPWRFAVVTGSAAMSVVMFVAARQLQQPMEATFGGALEARRGGWLAFLFAGAVLVTGYVVIERSHRVPGVRSVLRAVAVLGTKGLPGYATMVVALLVIDEFLPTWPRNDLMLIAVVAVCATGEFAAIRLGKRRRRQTIRTAAPLEVMPA